MNEMIVSQEKTIQPDAIVVIGAGLLRVDNQIICSSQTKKNIEKSMELLSYFSELTPLVFSGGFSLDNIDEATAMYKYFSKIFFIPYKDIYLEIQSRNSYDNIYYCLNLAEKNKWGKIVLIDQPMHLFQLKLLAYKEIGRRKSDIRIDFVGAESIWGENDQKQWKSPLIFVLYEILSTGYYLLKGKII